MADQNDPWELDDERYEVLLGELVYDYCDKAWQTRVIIARIRAEIAADELEDGPIHVRRILTHVRTVGSEN